MQGGFANAQRRKALLPQVIDAAAKLAQRIDQVANRTLMHARHTAQLKIAPHYREGRGERAYRRAGVAHEQIGFFVTELAVQPVDLNRAAALPHTTAQ